MNASYTKLKSGEWGIWVEGKVKAGKRTGCACGSIEGEYHDYYCSSCLFEELDQ